MFANICSQNPGFCTPSRMFKEESYEKYLSHLEKATETLFSETSFETFHVPPTYIEELMEYLKKEFPQYKVGALSDGCTIYIDGNFSEYLNEAIRDATRGAFIISTHNKYTEDICERLNQIFPQKKFEVRLHRDYYYATAFYEEDNNDEIIVLAGHECSGKWVSAYYYGKMYPGFMEKIRKEIASGKKIIITSINMELIQILKEEYPHISFELKDYKDIFTWESRENIDNAKKWNQDKVIVLDNFQLPVPYAFRKKAEKKLKKQELKKQKGEKDLLSILSSYWSFYFE